MKKIILSNGSVIFETKSGKYINPVSGEILSESQLLEKAPPSKKSEKWIKDNKAEFKKQYGKDYKSVLYATAWKKFNKLNEHADTGYVDKWREEGFDINVEDTMDGKKFTVTRNNKKFVINEPETGVYHTLGKSFNTFDEAISEIIKSKFEDNDIFEELKRMAGITEAYSPLEQTAYELGKMHKGTGTPKIGQSVSDDEFRKIIQDNPDKKDAIIKAWKAGVNSR